jgi:hypothetical protein
VGPRTSLDNIEKLKFLSIPGIELRTLSRPTRSQSLYRLRYRSSAKYILVIITETAITKKCMTAIVILFTF